MRGCTVSQSYRRSLISVNKCKSIQDEAICRETQYCQFVEGAAGGVPTSVIIIIAILVTVVIVILAFVFKKRSVGSTYPHNSHPQMAAPPRQEPSKQHGGGGLGTIQEESEFQSVNPSDTGKKGGGLH